MHETFAIETAATAVNDYEAERGKPMPNLTHGAIQANLIFELKSAYGKSYRVASEVSLDTKPMSSTPGVVVYPPRNLDFVNEPAKRSDAALKKVQTHTLEDGTPTHSFQTLMTELQGIVRNTCRTLGGADDTPTFEILTTPNSKQKRALELIAQIKM